MTHGPVLASRCDLCERHADGAEGLWLMYHRDTQKSAVCHLTCGEARQYETLEARRATQPARRERRVL